MKLAEDPWGAFRDIGPGSLAGFATALYLVGGRSAVGGAPFGLLDSNVVLQVRTWIPALLCVAILWQVASRPWVRPSVAAFAVGVPLFALWWFLLASTLWSPALDAAVLKAYELVLSGAVIALVMVVVSSAERARFLRVLWAGLFVATLVLALAGALVVLRGNIRRLAVFGGGPNVYGRLMGILAVVALHYWRRGSLRTAYAAVSGLALLLVLLSGSRGAMVSAIAGVMAFVVWERVSLREYRRLAMVAGVGLAGLLLFTPLGAMAMRIYERRIVASTIVTVRSGGREQIYAAAIALGERHPVSGSGLAGFSGTGLHKYPHNVFLEVFSEGGMLAMGLVVIVAGATTVVVLHRGWRRGPPVALGLLTLFLSAVQVSGDFFDSRGLPLMIMVTAAVLGDRALGAGSHALPAAGKDPAPWPVL